MMAARRHFPTLILILACTLAPMHARGYGPEPRKPQVAKGATQTGQNGQTSQTQSGPTFPNPPGAGIDNTTLKPSQISIPALIIALQDVPVTNFSPSTDENGNLVITISLRDEKPMRLTVPSSMTKKGLYPRATTANLTPEACHFEDKHSL